MFAALYLRPAGRQAARPRSEAGSHWLFHWQRGDFLRVPKATGAADRQSRQALQLRQLQLI